MALPDQLNDREKQKFRESPAGTKVAVTMEGDSGLLQGVEYDDIQVTYPTGQTEVYTFLKDGVQVAQIEVTYSSSSKHELTRARRI